MGILESAKSPLLRCTSAPPRCALPEGLKKDRGDLLKIRTAGKALPSRPFHFLLEVNPGDPTQRTL
jgi:hypothetical protein